jgi:glycosyltransferase involved in cell wall biosynthesis
MIHSLTVLICVHSKNDFYDLLLLKSLRSLEKQTFKNFKTLIVLDECWDNTEQKILNENLILDLVIKKKNIKNGLANAKNFGLSFVDTSLVAFLDADDLYIENKLEKQIKFFEESDVDFLGTQSWNINGDDENNIFESCFSLGTNETHDEISKNIYQENFLTHGSMMIKMDCLKKINYYNNITGIEDWDLWKRAINFGFNFYQIQERLYIYRLNTSTTR